MAGPTGPAGARIAMAGPRAGGGARPRTSGARPTPGRQAAREAVDGIDGVEVDELELTDLESVRSFAERFLSSDRGIDLVISNAGIMACPQTRVGPGWEAQFATITSVTSR